MNTNHSLTAQILYIIGILQMIAGVIIGLILANMTYNFMFSVFISWTLGSIVGGLFTIGFSKMVETLTNISINSERHLELLHALEKKLEKVEHKLALHPPSMGRITKIMMK